MSIHSTNFTTTAASEANASRLMEIARADRDMRTAAARANRYYAHLQANPMKVHEISDPRAVLAEMDRLTAAHRAKREG